MFVEWFMTESLREAKARKFELLKQTEGMSVLDYDTKIQSADEVCTVHGDNK